MDWPNDIIPYRWEFYLQPNSRGFMSPITRTRQVLEGQGPRWVASASIRIGTRTAAGRRKAQRFEAFLDKMKGQSVTANVWDFAVCGGIPLGPNLDQGLIPETWFTDGTRFTDGDSPETLTVFSGGIAVIETHSDWEIGDSSIVARGFPQDSTQLYAGDGVQIGTFLYRLNEDAVADGLGRATLSLNRPLIEDIADATIIIRTRPSTPMQLIDDDQSRRSADVGNVREYSVSLVECFF